jgi:hypothetical protein
VGRLVAWCWIDVFEPAGCLEIILWLQQLQKQEAAQILDYILLPEKISEESDGVFRVSHQLCFCLCANKFLAVNIR